MAAATLEEEVADNDVMAVLELEAFTNEYHTVATPVNSLVGGDTEVGSEVDGAGDHEDDDPERLL